MILIIIIHVFTTLHHSINQKHIIAHTLSLSVFHVTIIPELEDVTPALLFILLRLDSRFLVA